MGWYALTRSSHHRIRIAIALVIHSFDLRYLCQCNLHPTNSPLTMGWYDLTRSSYSGLLSHLLFTRLILRYLCQCRPSSDKLPAAGLLSHLLFTRLILRYLCQCIPSSDKLPVNGMGWYALTRSSHHSIGIAIALVIHSFDPSLSVPM